MEIINLDSVDSTNNFLKSRIHDYSDRDVMVIANEQTAGRGNGLNSWHSEKGENLTFSMLIHPITVTPTDSFILSQAMALALSDALTTWIPETRIKVKWPNDIYIVPDCKKLSGTLIETTMSAGKLQTAIIGVGINVNETLFPKELPNPISIAQVIGHSLDVDDVAHTIIKTFSKYYLMVENGQYNEIRKIYHSRLYLLNQEATFADKSHTFNATIKGVSPNGLLTMIDSEGKWRNYEFKEIKFK